MNRQLMQRLRETIAVKEPERLLDWENDLTDRNILVVGLGRSGLAAANFLAARGAAVSVTDVRTRAELAEAISQLRNPVRFCLGGHDTEDFVRAEIIVLSPGVPTDLPPLREAVARGIPILSEIELASRFLNGQVIAVTGSNGKTTTTTLIGRILRTAGLPYEVAGNIGKPLISCIGSSDVGNLRRTFVLELSSFQLETTSRFHSDIAVMLNLTPDHLDRYPDVSSYFKAKLRIFRNQSSRDWAIVNQDDPVVRSGSRDLRSGRFPFSITTELESGAFIRGSQIILRTREEEITLMEVSGIQLKGRHNLSNVLAAASACLLAGSPAESIREGILDFRGVEHRIEFVRRLEEVDYYNDSKATNVDSARKSIESFDQPIILIMGGLDKGGNFAVLAELAAAKVRRILAIGEAAPKILSQLGSRVPSFPCRDLAEAVESARSTARPHDVVLLAPACASFDMFENYEERGKAFKQYVNALSPTSQIKGSGRSQQ